MKYLMLALSLLSANVSAQDLDKLNTVVKENTYFLEIVGEALPGRERAVLGNGTGFAVSEYLIVTNNHVAAPANHLRIYNHEGQLVNSAKMIYSDPRYDIAILKTRDKMNTFVPLFDELATVNHLQELYAAGYPLGDKLMIVPGSFQGRSGGMPHYLRSISTTAPGMSGGPIFIYNEESERYEVIGIVTAFMYSEERGGIIIRFPTLQLFLSTEPVIEYLEENSILPHK